MDVAFEKKKRVLSMTLKEYGELLFILRTADAYYIDYPYNPLDKESSKDAKKTISLLKKWCNAFMICSNASLYPENSGY